jgi:polyhydroxyalkanoate synthesis regulator phasin
MKRRVSAAVAGVALAALIGVGVAAAAEGSGPAGRVAEALGGLVSRGTITQQQADAVSQALTDSWEQERAEREADRAARRAEVDALLQRTLGKDAEAVREEIRGGKTLREVAGDSADELAAGMLDLLGKRLDTAVKDGRITQDQAEETLSRATTRADAWVAGDDSGMMGRGLGLGLLFGPGMGDPDAGFGPGDGMGPGMMRDGRGPGGGWGPGPMWDDDEGVDQPGTADSSATSSTSWQA